MTPPLSFQLGHAAHDVYPWRVDDAPGRTFYLPRLEAVLTAECRSGAGWRCAVVARRRPCPDARHVVLSNAEIVAATATVVVDADDHDAVAMIWVAEVWRRWRGGLVNVGARTLAEDIRIPGTLVADVDLHALARMAEATRLRAPGIRRLLDRLATAGLLTSIESHADRGWGSYALRLPELAAAAPDTATTSVAINATPASTGSIHIGPCSAREGGSAGSSHGAPDLHHSPAIAAGDQSGEGGNMPDTAMLTNQADVADDFDLDITLLEVADAASLIATTDDNCGSTCGACTTNAA